MPAHSPNRIANLPDRGALSLLEVVLALAILAFATAYLAQSMQLATQNALRAQRLTKAELVAESVMNQVIAGVIPAQPVTWTPYYSASGQSEWMYQLQSVPTEVEGMLGLQVAVQQIDATSGLVQANYDLYANRWIIDPQLGLDTPPETTAEETSSSAGTSTSSGGSTSGGSSGSGAATGGGSSSTGGFPGGGGFAPSGPGGAGPGRPGGGGPGGGFGPGGGGGRGGAADGAGSRGGAQPDGGRRGGNAPGGRGTPAPGGGGFGPGGPGGGPRR